MVGLGNFPPRPVEPFGKRVPAPQSARSDGPDTPAGLFTYCRGDTEMTRTRALLTADEVGGTDTLAHILSVADEIRQRDFTPPPLRFASLSHYFALYRNNAPEQASWPVALFLLRDDAERFHASMAEPLSYSLIKLGGLS